MRTLAGLFIAGFIVLIYLSAKYTAEPRQPRPDLGKTVEWNNHGGLYYITSEQYETFDYIFHGVIVVFFCIAGVVALQSRYDK